MSQFFSGLKSRTDEVRLTAARNLQKFVSTELRELPADTYSTVLDEINQNIFALMSSPELHEKKGGVLAIGNNFVMLSQHWGLNTEHPSYLVAFRPSSHTCTSV